MSEANDISAMSFEAAVASVSCWAWQAGMSSMPI